MKQAIHNILITAGGTIVKIDDVRHIGNFSTGSFAAKIAAAALRKGRRIYYLRSLNAKTPPPHRKLMPISYETFDDYATKLKQLLQTKKIDMVFLAAAVSDYGVKPIKGKISSSRDSLTLRLSRLPKIITFVKKWSRGPVFQIGFKLLSGVSDGKLVNAAYKSGLANHSDLTIANDLAGLHSGKRESVVVTPEKGVLRIAGANAAEKVLDFAEKRAYVVHFKTEIHRTINFARKYKREIRLFTKICKQLAAKGHMPDFFQGSSSGHGSLALRMPGRSFLITARGSNKKRLGGGGVVLVKKVDWKNRKIFVESLAGAKASMNAVLVARIFEKFPHMNAVVHTHRFAPRVPETDFPYTPGTLEYANAPIKLFNKNRMVNLNNHGLVAVGEDLRKIAHDLLG